MSTATAIRRCTHPQCAFVANGGAPLARDNAGPYCGPCVQKESERRFSVGVTRPPQPARQPRREVAIRMDGVKMTPATLPRRNGHRGRDWRGMTRRFIQSGEECVLVEVEGCTNPHTLYTQITKAIKGDPELTIAKASVRQKNCYLVRVKAQK